MKLADLIRRFRTEANDKAQPYFWSDAEVTDWLNDAEEEAALRGRLIYEAANPDVCQIDIVAGQRVYPLHPAMVELSNLSFTAGPGERVYPVRLMSPEGIDRALPNWREQAGFDSGTRWCGWIIAIQSDRTLQIAPEPLIDGTLSMCGYRLPIAPMEPEDAEDVEPEINAAHHRHLIQWALHKAFSIPDTEAFDASRAEIAENEFTRYFGLRPDSDLRRSTREDETQTVKVFFP